MTDSAVDGFELDRGAAAADAAVHGGTDVLALFDLDPEIVADRAVDRLRPDLGRTAEKDLDGSVDGTQGNLFAQARTELELDPTVDRFELDLTRSTADDDLAVDRIGFDITLDTIDDEIPVDQLDPVDGRESRNRQGVLDFHRPWRSPSPRSRELG